MSFGKVCGLSCGNRGWGKLKIWFGGFKGWFNMCLSGDCMRWDGAKSRDGCKLGWIALLSAILWAWFIVVV